MGWTVDKNLSNRVVRFFEEYLTHCKGQWASKPFKLSPWQRKVLVDLFATVDDRTGLRRYRRCLIAVPRKNGKSTFAAGIALYLLLADGEPGAEVYSCAADRNQAGLVFDVAKQMLSQSPALGRMAHPFKHRIICEETASFYRPMASEAYTAWGVNPSGIIFDELHAIPDPDFYEAMTTSVGSRTQPLIVQITTAGWDRNSVCYREWEYARRVEEGLVDDPTFYSSIWSAQDGQDWTDETVWAASNPNLGVSLMPDYLRQRCAEALESPRKENSFRQLHLNQWTEQAERWLSMHRWDGCGSEFDEQELDGRQCYAGLDLSSTTDISALVLFFPGDPHRVLCRFWVPGDSARRRERQDRVPYVNWANHDLIRMTEGDVCDYDVIRNNILSLAKRFRIRKIAIDRWNATQLSTQLSGEGLDVVAFGQGFASMSAPCKQLERLVLEGNLNHGGNPVLRWMASNVAVVTDAVENIKMVKDRSRERIDGMIALAMAVGVASQQLNRRSVYADRGVIVV